jgi:hypothetical protein
MKKNEEIRTYAQPPGLDAKPQTVRIFAKATLCISRKQEKSPQLFQVAGFLFLVRLAGIEPTTPWFVAKYSIQLSYSRQDCYCTQKSVLN